MGYVDSHISHENMQRYRTTFKHADGGSAVISIEQFKQALKSLNIEYDSEQIPSLYELCQSEDGMNFREFVQVCHAQHYTITRFTNIPQLVEMIDRGIEAEKIRAKVESEPETFLLPERSGGGV